MLKGVSVEGKFLTDIWTFLGNKIRHLPLSCLKKLLNTYTYTQFILKNTPQIADAFWPLSAIVNDVYLQDLPMLTNHKWNTVGPFYKIFGK